MRIRIYIIDDSFGVRYDDERRFAPMSSVHPPSILASLRKDYSYETCNSFGFEILSDIEFNEEEE
ncbi:hypothetical protein MOO17_11480 [Escherichia coli]|uniref:hypothetical protein n=1 Tax=Escherichia coli TaxID=562 RepID=UPI001FF3BE01|nr:hypothetical protein [Escherichia coli]MCJ8478651.1 hypothetical protein [Escherichia coli]